MEVREWAIRILSGETLEEKLLNPGLFTDENRGSPILWKEPTRPPGMQFRPHHKGDKLPSFQELNNSDNRAVCLHRFAGHELLAVEMMAYVLLAFPDAPPSFRKGVVKTLLEEQQHVRLYMHQMERLGITFGDLPLHRHFWRHTSYITSPLHYVSVVALTFEMANLDFAQMYGKSFAHFGDIESAKTMATILKDEISHVKFGYLAFKQLKSENSSDWDAWTEVLSSTLVIPKRAKGFLLHEQPRKEAGIPEDWIHHLKNA